MALPVVAAALAPMLVWVLRGFAIKMIAVLGLSIMSYTGYIYALNQLKDYAVNAINAMPADMYQLFLISGLGQGLGYIFGAWSFVLTTQLLNKLSFNLGVSS